MSLAEGSPGGSRWYAYSSPRPGRGPGCLLTWSIHLRQATRRRSAAWSGVAPRRPTTRFSLYCPRPTDDGVHIRASVPEKSRHPSSEEHFISLRRQAPLASPGLNASAPMSTGIHSSGMGPLNDEPWELTMGTCTGPKPSQGTRETDQSSLWWIRSDRRKTFATESSDEKNLI